MNHFLPTRTLDDELRSLIVQHGTDAVREAVAQLTKKKRGRKPEKDWPLLAPIIVQDAIDWLEGKNPFKLRTNYAIAKAFAEANPGQSVFSTKERIEKKLREKRQWMTLARAQEISRTEYPFPLYLQSLKELARIDDHPVWVEILGMKEERVDRYRQRYGEPEADMTFAAIDEKVSNVFSYLAALPPPPPQRIGLLGHVINRADKIE